MSNTHNHSHNHSEGNIKIAFFLNLGFTIVEIIGGLYTNSLAILSDALHDLGDSLSLGLSWYFQRLSKIVEIKKKIHSVLNNDPIQHITIEFEEIDENYHTNEI